MTQRHLKKQDKQLRIAREEVARLLAMAADTKSQKLADRYVLLARKLAMRFRLRLSSAQKRRFCKKCGAFFRIGKNCRVRVRDGKTTYACLACKAVQRIPYR